ncbi:MULTISPECIES: DUF6082 family protein [unclassified Streptomyces]|uniref:DUF6082 family protein n=1 Tax=unclassified Streptomyces TaxID=2593676 RepID=UPI00093BC0DB|nr:DUF6082 family protein [Streptomyces sp. TSRI0281]OKI45324.1 spore associated protein, SapC [Streptomyces sp. TSRI0281]
MKTSHALLAIAAVGTAHLVARERQHRQQKVVAVARMHDQWLTLLTTNLDLAEQWAPEGMDVKEYVTLLNANQQLCALALRYRLGLISKDRLRFVVQAVMERESVRQYWEKFGAFRAEESLDNKADADFNDIVGDVYDARRAMQTAGA